MYTPEVGITLKDLQKDVDFLKLRYSLDEKGKAEAEDKVGDIIRCLPSHLIYKSLDGIFKEWRVEKKGGR